MLCLQTDDSTDIEGANTDDDDEDEVESLLRVITSLMLCKGGACIVTIRSSSGAIAVLSMS